MPNNLQPTNSPKNKVIAATGGAAIGSAVAVILTWIVTAAFTKVGISLPENVSNAFSVIFTTITTFLAGYYTPAGANEGVVTVNGQVKSATIV
jgi:hypothetical protein